MAPRGRLWTRRGLLSWVTLRRLASAGVARHRHASVGVAWRRHAGTGLWDVPAAIRRGDALVRAACRHSSAARMRRRVMGVHVNCQGDASSPSDGSRGARRRRARAATCGRSRGDATEARSYRRRDDVRRSRRGHEGSEGSRGAGGGGGARQKGAGSGVVGRFHGEGGAAGQNLTSGAVRSEGQYVSVLGRTTYRPSRGRACMV